MTASPADFSIDDFSDRVSAQGIISPVQILTPLVAGLLTGFGFAASSRSAWEAASSDLGEVRCFTPVSSEATSIPIPAGELVTKIREGWQLNMTELAEILSISRPTLYNWLKGKPVADSKVLYHMQALAAAAETWQEQANQGGQDFLLDYTGPRADEESIRQAMRRPEVTAEELRALVGCRWGQYSEAREQTRAILGSPLHLPASSPPESSRRLNKLWAENAKALHAARNR